MDIERRLAALESEIQELRRKSEEHTRIKNQVLEAISLEVGNLQKINKTAENPDVIRTNAECIARLGLTFVEILNAR